MCGAARTVRNAQQQQRGAKESLSDVHAAMGVAVLYGIWRIACRRCHRLRYLSQRETEEDRATRAMLKIVKRLNPDDPDPCNDLPEKPNGMHWSTYDRLVERYEGYSEQWGLAILRRLGRRRT